jgi:hypothetical protein
LGALGKAAVFAQNERSVYTVKVVVDCAGAALDPSADQTVRVV